MEIRRCAIPNRATLPKERENFRPSFSKSNQRLNWRPSTAIAVGREKLSRKLTMAIPSPGGEGQVRASVPLF
jgi:hypothetical protein